MKKLNVTMAKMLQDSSSSGVRYDNNHHVDSASEYDNQYYSFTTNHNTIPLTIDWKNYKYKDNEYDCDNKM